MVTANAISGTVPDHVPPALVHGLNVSDSPEVLADPYGLFARMHADYPPVSFTPGHGHYPPHWLLTNHADCLRVLREAETFTSKGTTPFPRDPDNWYDFIPIEIEPPAHRKYRNLLDPFFSPQAVLRLEADVRRMANDLIDGFVDRGGCEFTEEFSRPLPVSVFLGIMGLPQEKRGQFVQWTMDLLHSENPETILAATNAIGDYLNVEIEKRRRTPDGGALSGIVNGLVEGRPLTEKEIFGFAFFVFIAGIDTVYATFNNVWNWLAANPDRRQEIIERPDNIANAVEELHRVFTVTFSGRFVKQDTEISGAPIKAGDRVLCVLPAANYAPSVWADPEKVDFNRPRKLILSFAGGVHSCMGAHCRRHISR